jgi:hypothetical protein
MKAKVKIQLEPMEWLEVLVILSAMMVIYVKITWIVLKL